jgi:hypothetical protein
MRSLTKEDLKTFENLVGLTQQGMHQAMCIYLKSKYAQVKVTKDYIIAIGEIPIGLVAHMDTVFKAPVKNLYYDQQKGILWSPEGLGADDRAGIFAILKIIESGLRPSIIFTTDEEIGGIGASALSEIECPIPNLKYLIQLDRRGTNDCVFYDCYNPDFTTYIESFGFIENYGSFSDISFLCPEWKVCGVNLSVGYENEHSIAETCNVNALYDTIKKVQRMLRVNHIPDFEYAELPSMYSRWFDGISSCDDLDLYGYAYCTKCHRVFADYELIPTKGKDKNTKYYCPDCICDTVEWCDICGEAYETTNKTTNSHLCDDCKTKEPAKKDV